MYTCIFAHAAQSINIHYNTIQWTSRIKVYMLLVEFIYVNYDFQDFYNCYNTESKR